MKNLFTEYGNELHHTAVKKFERRKVYVKDIDEIWAADLIEMGRCLKNRNKIYSKSINESQIFSSSKSFHFSPL